MGAMAPRRITTVTITKARACLEDLIRRVEAGEEFVVTRNRVPAARLVPARRLEARTPGSARGLVTMAPDFDAPLGDLQEYERQAPPRQGTFGRRGARSLRARRGSYRQRQRRPV